MVPTNFNESNHTLNKPSDMTHEQCEPLSVWVGKSKEGMPWCISCWKLTKEELEEFQLTGRIWLMLVGNTMPPAALTAINPFKESLTGLKASRS